jgi:hypothetical protein
MGMPPGHGMPTKPRQADRSMRGDHAAGFFHGRTALGFGTLAKRIVILSGRGVQPCRTVPNGPSHKAPMNRILTLIAALCLSLPAWAGTWGEGSFENDDAMEWVAQCTQSTGWQIVAATLTGPIFKAKLIEAPDGASVVAAAEVVAAAAGRPSPDMPPALKSWVESQPRRKLVELVPMARQALLKVSDPSVSELKRVWSGDKDKANQWEKRIAELDARLAD